MKNQISGNAMGTTMVPSFASLFVGHLEEEKLYDIIIPFCLLLCLGRDTLITCFYFEGGLYTPS